MQGESIKLDFEVHQSIILTGSFATINYSNLEKILSISKLLKRFSLFIG